MFEKYAEVGIGYSFVQDNESFSQKNTIRGLHFQCGNHAQGKLVRVITGKIIDYAVDIRHGSPTFGKYVSAELSGDNHNQLWIPPGFAHGFEVLEDNTIVQYKCTKRYSKKHDRGIIYNDPDINICWETKDPILSEKDKTHLKLRNMDIYFEYKLEKDNTCN